MKGSLRFDYMVFVSDEYIDKLVIKEIEDEKYLKSDSEKMMREDIWKIRSQIVR